jgi:hypothetical protein
MAENRALAASEHRGEPATPNVEPVVANRVDAAVDAM